MPSWVKRDRKLVTGNAPSYTLLFQGTYYGLHVCVPPKFIGSDPTPKRMVLGVGALGRYLGLGEVMRMETVRGRDRNWLSQPCEDK